MTRRRWCGTLVLVLTTLGVAPADAQTSQTPQTSQGVPPKAAKPAECVPEVSNGGRTIVVDWEKAVACLAKPDSKWNGRVAGRIDEDASVTIRSTHFNFIKYAVKYQVDETVVESYVLLAKLWQGVLGLGLTPSLQAEIARMGIGPANPILEWARAVATAQTELDKAAQSAPNRAFLTQGEIVTVSASVVTLTAARGEVMQKYEAAAQFNAFADYEQYTKVKAFHDAVLARLDAYLDLASLTADGQVKTIPKKKGGTIVTVTMTPATNAGAERAPTLTVEYFSHSRLPLTFHAGYALARLEEFEFEEVTAFVNSDMFARIKSNDNTQAFTAFMTYEPRAWIEQKLGVGFTLGTDIVKPGQRLFVGGSLRYARFVFTYGGMSGELEEGVDPAIETFSDGSTREVFGAIASRRDWGQFFALSVKVF